MFEQVRRARVSGEIATQIEGVIVRGRLNPGDRLPTEQELADQFGASRMTVRDALRILEERGLIRVKVGAGGGTFVADATMERVAETMSTMLQLKRMTLADIAEARKIVEGVVAELAAVRATKADVRELESSVEAGERSVAETASHLQASMGFHVMLARAAHNPVLYATVRAYHQLLTAALAGMRDPRSARATQLIHRKMLAALKARDGAQLRKLTLDHLTESEKRLRRWLQSGSGNGQRGSEGAVVTVPIAAAGAARRARSQGK